MIIGARQVGKTYSVKEFCEGNFLEYLYINLEKDDQIKAIFQESIDPEIIIRQIGFLKNKAIDISNIIIFIDEIQQSERAIMSLKYCAESTSNYKIIAAGSLLGVALNRFTSSFPIGKVKRHYLYPMDFEEFLLALGQGDLADEISDCYMNDRKMFEPVHIKLMSYYNDYLYVGGMPESVLK